MKSTERDKLAVPWFKQSTYREPKDYGLEEQKSVWKRDGVRASGKQKLIKGVLKIQNGHGKELCQQNRHGKERCQAKSDTLEMVYDETGPELEQQTPHFSLSYTDKIEEEEEALPDFDPENGIVDLGSYNKRFSVRRGTELSYIGRYIGTW